MGHIAHLKNSSNQHLAMIINTIMLTEKSKTNVPDTMITLGQRWQTVVPLAESWRWVHNDGPTLGQHHRVLDENWKSVPFILLA